jgi:RHS repeat-associated protein
MYDGDSGLIRFGKRDLDPTIGRWTAKDPIRFNGGQGNLFLYVDGDPVNRIDVDGRFAPGPAAGAGAGAGFAAGAAAGAAAYAFGYYVLGPIVFAIEDAKANDEARQASSCEGAPSPEPPEPAEICKLAYEMGEECVYECPHSGTIVKTKRHGFGPGYDPANDVCPRTIILD